MTGCRGLKYATLLRADQRASVLRWFADVTADASQAPSEAVDQAGADAKPSPAVTKSLAMVEAFAQLLSAVEQAQHAAAPPRTAAAPRLAPRSDGVRRRRAPQSDELIAV